MKSQAFLSCVLAAASYEPITSKGNGAQCNEDIRAVTISGWLLLDRLTSAKNKIWEGIPGTIRNERDFMSYFSEADQPVAVERINDFRSTVITETDIQEMHGYGLNHVKVQLSYGTRNLDNEKDKKYNSVFVPAMDHLHNLYKWTAKYKIDVTVQLTVHKVCQSLQAMANCHSDDKGKWTADTDLNDSVTWAVGIAKDAGMYPSFKRIELLYEPTNDINVAKLKEYYSTVINKIKDFRLDIIAPVPGQSYSELWQWAVWKTNQKYDNLYLSIPSFFRYTDKPQSVLEVGGILQTRSRILESSIQFVEVSGWSLDITEFINKLYTLNESGMPYKPGKEVIQRIFASQSYAYCRVMISFYSFWGSHTSDTKEFSYSLRYFLKNELIPYRKRQLLL